MSKELCLHCKSIFDISDDIAECTACGAVMRVVEWNPFELELLEAGSIDNEKVKPVTEHDFYKYRTVGRRFNAGIVDGIVLLPISLIGRWAIDLNNPPILIVVGLIISYSVFWVYSVIMHGYYGQTVGKMVCGIEVLDVSEQPITMRQAVLRDSVIIVISIVNLILSLYIVLAGSEINLIRLVILILAMWVAESIWFIAEILTLLTNKKRRAIHDFIAGTVVVRVRSQPQEEVGA